VKTLKLSALALLSALSLAACDGDGGTGVGGLRQGQFEGEITGVLDIGLAGDAESGDYISTDHNLILLTDVNRSIQIAIYNFDDPYTPGSWAIDDEEEFDSRIVAYVLDLETGESFGSVNGTLTLNDVGGDGIEGSAVFTAESDEILGDLITVDVVFDTDFTSGIDFNRSPSFSTSPRR
jgi:hypothetical protein